MTALDDLARRLAPVCESAVSPLEVASALEFEGFSDRAAREEYGADDVFALARDLYERVPRRPAPPAPSPDPWAAGRFRPLLRSALYALPAVCFPAGAALLAGPGVVPVLVAALLAGWGLSQGLAGVGYARLASAGPPGASRVLRAGLPACLLVAVAVLAVAARLSGARAPAAEFGAGEDAYMLAACVLLVAGTERWLLVALAPSAAGGALYLALGQPPRLEHLAWASLAATPLLACVLALSPASTAGPQWRPSSGYAGPGWVPARAELRAAAPAALLGVVAGALLALPVAVGPDGAGGPNPGAILASVPMALSMGAAEWGLARYRRRGQALLRATGSPRWFAWRARLALAGALLAYLTATVVLVSAAADVAYVTHQITPSWPVLAQACGYVLLGTALFSVLLLQSVRVRAVPLALCAAALAAEYALRRHGLIAETGVPGVLAVATTAYALAKAGNTTLHT